VLLSATMRPTKTVVHQRVPFSLRHERGAHARDPTHSDSAEPDCSWKQNDLAGRVAIHLFPLAPPHPLT